MGTTSTYHSWIGKTHQQKASTALRHSESLADETEHNVRGKIKRKKNKQKVYYNSGTKDLRPLKRGDIVRVHPLPTDKQGRWFKAKVERKADIRSYIVRTERGQEYRRNRKHLCVTKETFEDSVIGEDYTQDRPAEGEEHVERATENNANQTANTGKTGTNSRDNVTKNKWQRNKTS